MAINERLATISRGGSIDEDSSEEEDLEDNAPERNDDDDDDTNVWNLHAIEREFPHLVSLFELGAYLARFCIAGRQANPIHLPPCSPQAHQDAKAVKISKICDSLNHSCA